MNGLRRYIQDRLVSQSPSGSVTANYGNSYRYDSGSFTVSLPTAVGCQGYRIQVSNAGTGQITIDPNGSETIIGESSVILLQWDSVTLESDGNNWIIV